MSLEDLPLFVKTLSGVSGIDGAKDGPRDEAQFSQPYMVSLDPFNRTNLYVLDTGNNCIRIVDTRNGFASTFAGICMTKGYIDGPGISALFNDPFGLLFLDDGTMVVSDRSNHVLRKLYRNGTVSTFSGDGVQGFRDGDAKFARFVDPSGIDLQPETGNIVVADGIGERIRMVFPDGSVTTIAGTGMVGSENGPALQATFSHPCDVKFDRNGALFIADSTNSMIRKMVNGYVSTYAGESGPGYKDGPLSGAKFHNGNGISFDNRGDLIVSDLYNNLIRKVKVRNSTMETIAGMLNPVGNKDGIARQSTFSVPSVMYVDLETNIVYMSGRNLNNIKMICSAPCYNGGTYDCLSKVCTCAGKWLPPYCLSRTISSTKTLTTSTSSSSAATLFSYPIDQTGIGVNVIAIASAGSLLFVAMIVYAWNFTLKRKTESQKKQILYQNTKPTKLRTRDSSFIFLNNNTINSAVPSTFQSRDNSFTSKPNSKLIPNFDMGITMTKTFSSVEKVVSIPGYCLLDLDTDLNMNSEAKLGEGGTAIIYKCCLARASLIAKYSFNEVALKVLKGHDKQDVDDIKFEIAIMSSIPPHKNVIHFVGYSEVPMAIVMKYYRLSLKDLLQSDTQITDYIQMKVARDIASGMTHIHENGVLHLDLKPHNVLLDLMADNTFDCVVCDFGFANFTKESKKQFVSGLVTINAAGITPRYAAPEMIQSFGVRKIRFDEEIHKKIDVYSYSIILYELLNIAAAWQGLGHHEICDAVLAGKRPDVKNLKFQNPLLEEIMIECWKQNPNDRPDFSSIIFKINNFLSDLSNSDDGRNGSSLFSANSTKLSELSSKNVH